MTTPTILRVAVPSPLYRYFDYLAPDGIDPTQLQPGIRLRVPFGRRRVIGVLLELASETPIAPESLRQALDILDQEPLLPAELLALIRWARDYYQHPPGEVFATALPSLLRKGKPATQEKEMLWRITSTGKAALANASLSRAPRQQALLKQLAQTPAGLNEQQLRQFQTGWSAPTRTLIDKGFVEITEAIPASTKTTATPPDLNPDQAAAVEAVLGSLNQFQAFLLDGVTGSGKTEVYLRVVEAILAQQQQALILVPEISLTPQLLGRFQARFPGPLAVLHSGLSDRERLNAWIAAKEGTAQVVIGTRSAIFTPLAQPGVIIIDEEHDSSLKQQEGFRYNARDLAVMRARGLKIPIVLGSATPALESIYNSDQGRYRLLNLPQRVGEAEEPTIELLDLRRKPMEEGLSEPLLQLIERHLSDGGQALLFLNRRGFAPTLICHECGWLGYCPECDARLTLHLRRQRLMCHHCGIEQAIPKACPGCGSVDIRALGQGTERIEKALQKHFPKTGIARIDRDSTRRKGSLQKLLKAVESGERRLLIGTQMLAKGHHFPNVTLVGIVDADQGLFSADYRASERMAQLILQVAGRAGRAEKPGVVIVQTHHPDHPLLQTLVYQGYRPFAEAALIERQAALLPPFAYQALLRSDAIEAEPPHTFLREAATLGAEYAAEIEILGPVPAPMERRAGRYRAQLLIQAQQRADLHRFLRPWVQQLGELKSARKVRWSLDVDPLDLF